MWGIVNAKWMKISFEPGRKEPSSNHSRFSDSMGILAENAMVLRLQETASSEVCVQVIERR
jgi:hypothetical protein